MKNRSLKQAKAATKKVVLEWLGVLRGHKRKHFVRFLGEYGLKLIASEHGIEAPTAYMLLPNSPMIPLMGRVEQIAASFEVDEAVVITKLVELLDESVNDFDKLPAATRGAN